MEETQDYSQFRKLAKDIVDSQHFELLEILTNRIYSSINDNKFVISAKVNISKPNIHYEDQCAWKI